MLNNFSFDMRKQLSLIIGKNNTGKTSFLTAMDSFFNYYVGAFSYDDFSFQLREKGWPVRGGMLAARTWHAHVPELEIKRVKQLHDYHPGSQTKKIAYLRFCQHLEEIGRAHV